MFSHAYACILYLLNISSLPFTTIFPRGRLWDAAHESLSTRTWSFGLMILLAFVQPLPILLLDQVTS
jgi:hypothetical protein